MEIKGNVIKIYPTKNITDKFSKREFVIKTAGDYPQSILLQTVNDKTELLDKIGLGEEVTAQINIRGREWTDPQGEVKYFNSLEAWKIDNQSANNNQTGKNFEQQQRPAEAVSDDLPF